MIRADRVTERMEALGLNAHAAAKQAGLGPDFVRDILRGRTKDPSGWRLRLLAEVLQCSPEYLMGMADELGSAPTIRGDGAERIARLYIRFELKAGYFHEPGARVYSDGMGPYDEDFAVVSLTEPELDEWLEIVIDPQHGGRFRRGDLLHVVPFEEPDNDCLVVVHHYDGQLINRSVRSLTFDRTGACIWPPIEGATSEDIANVVAGGSAKSFSIEGRVMRGYSFPDNSGPIRYQY